MSKRRKPKNSAIYALKKRKKRKKGKYSHLKHAPRGRKIERRRMAPEAREDVREMFQRARDNVFPHRAPKFFLGNRLRNQHGFVGFVTAIYADYWAAVEGNAVPAGWFAMQKTAPSTKDQVFYGIVGRGGDGACLVGETEATFEADPSAIGTTGDSSCL